MRIPKTSTAMWMMMVQGSFRFIGQSVFVKKRGLSTEFVVRDTLTRRNSQIILRIGRGAQGAELTLFPGKLKRGETLDMLDLTIGSYLELTKGETLYRITLPEEFLQYCLVA